MPMTLSFEASRNDRALLRGHGQRHIALFRVGDQGDGFARCRHDPGRDDHAFVDDEFELHAAAVEQGRDFARPAARRLLRRGQTRSLTCVWLRAGGGEHLDGFQVGDQAALVVPRAAPPDEAVGDIAAEGRMLPVLFGAGRDRHDILMAHQHRGLERLVRTSHV